MDISLPTVGPIVGHTTSQECRIFLRIKAGDMAVPHFAVVRYRVKGSNDWSAPLFNRLMSSNDMSAVVLLSALNDDTVYDYQAGWLSANTSLDNVALHSARLNWPSTVHTFKTATTNPRKARNFIVGSCRYTHSLRSGRASAAWPNQGDQLFKVMAHKLTRQKIPIDAMFLVGGQIYAGDLNQANPAVAQEDFCNRYRVAFSQPGISTMLSNVPTYMIFNEHEIQAHRPTKATTKDKDLLYPAAIKAYSIYQASHGPLFSATRSRDISAAVIPKKFWYSVANGTSDWFVLDVRTERNVQACANKILGDAQMTALLNWMRSSRARVKFVVTPVTFFPDLKLDQGDRWKSFPTQRHQILEFIRLNKIKNVVFISGDVHGSVAAKMTCSSDPDFSVYSIMSSPLFKSPLPATYTYKSDFILNEPISTSEEGDYNHHLISHVHSEDNFAYLSADDKEVRVQFFGKNGQPLEKQQVVIPLK